MTKATQKLVAAVARNALCARPMASARPMSAMRTSFVSRDAGGATSDVYNARPMTETVRTFLKPAHFAALLRSKGTEFFVGVPDSLLSDICAYITSSMPPDKHIICANEGTALATAAGNYLATGRIPFVYLQNSGLGNLVNPLLSLCSKEVYQLPVLLMIGWRGEPGKKDEPQHLLQGSVTPSMLKEMGIPYEIMPDYAEGAFEVLNKAYEYMEAERAPFAILIKKQTFEPFKLKPESSPFPDSANMLHREQILDHIITAFPSDPLVTTTGFTSREMFELRENRGQDHSHDFLTVGSMGHCPSIALGIALAKPSGQVVAVDGDGAAIMHMGGFVTVGKSGARNFKHVLINNAIHDSVGGQPTGAQNVDFPGIALSCGYKSATSVSAASDLPAALNELREGDGPRFLEIRALPGARADLGRPTQTPVQNRDAFMGMLKEL